MKSSSGEHFIALDHVRALAAFLVFTWHFTHGEAGYPVPFDYVPPVFFLAPLDEGHTGVALFMTLSGYLFAKLLSGKEISITVFLWNRVLRLGPLLIVVISIVGLQEWLAGESFRAYFFSVASGLILPTLPNGGWSITTELHFYVLLPLLLWLLRRRPLLLASLVGAAVLIRIGLYAYLGEVQSPAYWTIIGRIDQFILGMVAFHYRFVVCRRHFMAAAVLIGFCLFYWFRFLRRFLSQSVLPIPESHLDIPSHDRGFGICRWHRLLRQQLCTVAHRHLEVFLRDWKIFVLDLSASFF